MMIIDDRPIGSAVRGMFEGTARKRTLVEYGFRLPSEWTIGR